MEQLEMFSALRKSEIVREAFVVVTEVVLDGVRPISQAQDEIAMAEMCVVLHHMPQDGAIADRHHGFGDVVRIFPQPHSQTAAKEDDLHCLNSLSMVTKNN